MRTPNPGYGTYIVLAVVFFFSTLAVMSQNLLYRVYVILSVLLFIFIFSAWGAGSHGHMFANKSEALGIVLVLLVVAIPPIVLKFYRSSKSVDRIFSVFIFILLLVKLSVVGYLIFEYVSGFNLGTVVSILMCLSLISQMYFIARSVVSRP
jgi:hypothetical protein